MHISGKCKWRFDGKKCNSDQWWNNGKCRCGCKELHVCERDYVWNTATCNCGYGKYLASIMDNLAIMCDEILDADADEEANSNSKAKLINKAKSNNEKTKTNFNEKTFCKA